ncbi:MAG: DUF2147 domain-containing protein [Alphaproteobacteria bacterium]
MRIMLVTLVCAFSMMLGGTASAQTAEDAFGKWRHPENGSLISVYKCGGKLCAKVVKVTDPSRKDSKNPNPKLRNRSVVGVVIMKGAKKTSKTAWSGNLYNTQDGKTYSGTVTVIDKNHLKLQGCVLGGLICQGPTWTRVK